MRAVSDMLRLLLKNGILFWLILVCAMLKIKPDWVIVCKNQFHFWLVQPCYGLIAELQFDLTGQTGFY